MPSPRPLRGHRAIAAALDRLERGIAVLKTDAETLLSARAGNLDRLLALSSRLRDDGLRSAGRDRVITFSKKVFIPVTQLCQDRCHYCVFVDTPNGLHDRGIPTYLSPDEMLRIAHKGATLGCKEALFTLGDRPENRWPAARRWLDDHGYASTLDYVAAMAELVLTETGLLPHLNPGVMSWAELQRLRPYAPSMGMMLETTATRLWAEKGGVHFGSPDKNPEVRLRVIDDAGRCRIPFTTGVLLGIGETDAERVEALFAIRDSHERHGHIQETIVQNFRAKPRTAMQNEQDLELQEYAAAVAVARIIMGPDATIQAPPNLTDLGELRLLVRAGINDWGGVSPLTPDHVNPERPWPELETLNRLTTEIGYKLHERLTAHPQYLRDAGTWLDAGLRPHVEALIDPVTALAIETAPVTGRPLATFRAPAPNRYLLQSPLARASLNPSGLTDAEYAHLLTLRGRDLDHLASVADEVRASKGLDDVTFVVNRNLDSSLFASEDSEATCESGVRRLTPNTIVRLVEEAVDLGATEICIQGAVPTGLPGDVYLDIVRKVRRHGPSLSIHAYRPTEIADGAARLGISREEFLVALQEAGATSVPGTQARILDDHLRSILSEQTDPSVGEWTAAMEAAHRSGLRSTATMVYGHLETPADAIAHLRRLAAVQDRTGGFTEFIAMPYVPSEAPAAVRRRAGEGPTLDQSRALYAVARLLLHDRIDHVQSAWTKLGFAGAAAVLQGGADDFGGLLIDGSLWPEAGAEAGREATREDVIRIAAQAGRGARERTTEYGAP